MQDLFCREYLIDLCAAKAARRAGYSENTSEDAWKILLGSKNVQARLAELFAERNRRLEIDANKVLTEILAIALADPADAYDEGGAFKRNINDIPSALRRTISSIKTADILQGEGPNREWVGEVKEVKFWDKTRALDMLMRHLALYRDTLKVEGLDDMAARILAARKRTGPA